MELPDCPPGAEGYQDSVTEVPKKPEEVATCTKAELEFQEHLNSLKIRTEDGNHRCMVERRGRDVSGKWIYLCYPCAAMCSGESILQTHISGKKHKNKLSMKTVWPLSIFEEHPYVQSEKGNKSAVTDLVLQKVAEEVELHKKSELDLKFETYRNVRCHIQETLDTVKAPLLGMEYLIEHPPQEEHYEPSYTCVLCLKQGHPRTIINHLTCFWHRCNYLTRHFSKASALMAPYRYQSCYREGVSVIMNHLALRIQDKFGRMKPLNIEKEDYERDKDHIHQWIIRGPHFSEAENCTFEEVVDADLILSLNSSKTVRNKRDPSPPVVAAPSKPVPNYRKNRGIRQGSIESLSDVSDEPEVGVNKDKSPNRSQPSKRFDPYPEPRRPSPPRSRYSANNFLQKKSARPPNYAYKVKLAQEQRQNAEALALKALAYHEKNPEKHPLYPEEWKKFWNRRYKEIQAEGKDPSKHEFKPEWIVFWTARMKELHEEELRATVSEVYRRLRLTPPAATDRRSAERRRTPRRRSPAPLRRSPDYRDYRLLGRRSPSHSSPRRASPRRASPRRASPRRASPRRASPRRVSPRRRSPLRHLRTRSRSPVYKLMGKSTRSPLSRRKSVPRNKSPRAFLDTVLISDEELKPDDSLSPWNSADSMDSLPDARSPSRKRSRTGSVAPRRDRDRDRDHVSVPQDFGSAENVVATLRTLVALEDYLGSLGPKIVDLLAEALKMEKDKANSSELLLETESAVVLIETAKEKLKGAAQAGLVPAAAAHAVRAAVVRAAATLHEADTRANNKKTQRERSAAQRVPVAGVGAVDREQVARQMAAALVAQGKTDVSAEELAHLVDAVVGMAEAKKREQELNKKATSEPSARVTGSASALQMLQSAYDDRNKLEKDYTPDAMDGLSDSDLETLLKNFNELSAEEQHSLIAYLKKLEAREPQRVERLRQYVSIAAAAPVPVEEKPIIVSDTKPVPIESDDDDYTVEDIFKSATQKVKEDQIRQEMEIVKKSIQESKEIPKAAAEDASVDKDTSKNVFSASDLLALVQASLQSTPAPNPAQTASSTLVSDVVASNTQPRSFGDLPEPSMTEGSNPLPPNSSQSLSNQMLNQPEFMRNLQNAVNFGNNAQQELRQDVDDRSIAIHNNIINQETRVQKGNYISQVPTIPQGNFIHRPLGAPHDNFNAGSRGGDNYRVRGPQDTYEQGNREAYNNNSKSSFDNYSQPLLRSQNNLNQGSCGPTDNSGQAHRIDDNSNTALRGYIDNYNLGQRGPEDNLNYGPRGPLNNYGQGPQAFQDNYNQVVRGPQDNFSQGLRRPQDGFSQGQRGPQDNFTQAQRGPQDNIKQGLRGPQDSFNQIQRIPHDNLRQEQRGPQDNFNQGQRGPQDNFNQGQRGPQDNFNQGQRGPQENFNQRQRGPQDNFNQGQRGPQDSFIQGQRGHQDNFKQGQRGPQDKFNQGPRGPLDIFNQGQRGQQDNFSHGQRGPQDNFNQGQRGQQDNFKQGQRGPQDNFSQGQKRPQDNCNQAQRGPQIYSQNQESFTPLPSLLDSVHQNPKAQDQSFGGIGTNNIFNQSSYSGNRVQDNYNKTVDVNAQTSDQKFGSYEQNNFRGRGRGYAGQRGRGRGYY